MKGNQRHGTPMTEGHFFLRYGHTYSSPLEEKQGAEDMKVQVKG
jgi:hypothetical protein